MPDSFDGGAKARHTWAGEAYHSIVSSSRHHDDSLQAYLHAAP
ncbi:hypothetical protein ACFV1N_15520 [Streptosporangium canum]